MADRVHATALAAIHETSFPPAERWSAAAFATQLSLPGVFALAADAHGFVLARAAADEAEILTLAVLPAMRRRGLGRLLLAAAVRHAAGLGVSAMFLEVAETNEAARGLYRDMGFRDVGRRQGYYPSGESAVVLRLDISPSAATTV